MTITVGPPGGGRGADPRRDQAVDAVGAAVGEEAHVGVGARQERLLVADRHARRGVDELAVGVGGAERRVQARLGRLARAQSSSAAIAAAAASAAPSQRVGPAVGRPARRAGSASDAASAAGSARTIAPAIRVGSFQPCAGSTTSWRASSSVGEPLAQRLAGRHVAEAQDQVGRERVRARAGDRLVGRDDQPRSCGPRRSCEVGSARIGKPVAAARPAISRRGAGSACARRRSGPGATPPTRSASASTSGRRGRRRRRRHRGQRPVARGPRAPASSVAVTSSGRGSGPSGSRQGTFRWTGPGRGSPAAVQKARQATERKCRRPGVVGVVGADLAEPAHRRRRRASSWSIVCPAPIPRSSGGRSAVSTISGTADSSASQTAGWRLAAAVPEVQRIATGVPGRLRGAEREEAAAALVDDHVRLDRRLAPERQRERGRARARGDHRVAHPAAGELLGHRRGERGVAVGRVHRRER